MTLKQTIGRWEPTVSQLIILLALLQLFITLLTNGFALSADEAMWHYIGRNWFRHGLVPYSGGADNKSPLIFAVFGLSDWLFGVNYWFPRVLGTICQSVGIYYVYKTANQIAGKQAGILAITLYGLSVLWHCVDGRYASYTETYEVMFIVISFYLYLVSQNYRGFFLSGFLAGIGLGFRVSALFGIIPLFIACFKKGRVFALMFFLGVLSGIFFLTGIGVLAGINLYDVYINLLADNFGPGSTTDHSALWKMEQFSNMFFYSELVLFYPLVLFYFFIKKEADWVVLWLIFEFIGICVVGNYARVHLKDLLPALSLISAFSISYLINNHKIPSKYIIPIVWICFFPKLLEPLVNLKKIFIKQKIKEVYCKEPFTQPDEYRSKQLGLWVKSNTTGQEKVLVAGFGAQVQVYSERISPTIFFQCHANPDCQATVL
jgi:hypothetical protein